MSKLTKKSKGATLFHLSSNSIAILAGGLNNHHDVIWKFSKTENIDNNNVVIINLKCSLIFLISFQNKFKKHNITIPVIEPFKDNNVAIKSERNIVMCSFFSEIYL
mgnify:CR=1 FL=1